MRSVSSVRKSWELLRSEASEPSQRCLNASTFSSVAIMPTGTVHEVSLRVAHALPRR